jgi:hypothetical protein
MLIHVSLCLCTSIQSTKCWQMWHMFNTSWIIVWQLPIAIPTSDAIWSTDFLLLLLSISGTCLTFALFVDIDGWPIHGSLSTLSHPSWKHLCQSNTSDCFIALSPYTCCNMVNVSAGDFCSQTQNLIFVQCSITNIFNCDVTSHTLKKQTRAVMPSEAMKWQNYFCDDGMHSANLRHKFPCCGNSCKLYQQIPVNHTSEFKELFEATMDKCLSPEHTKEVLWLGRWSTVVVINM